MSDRALSSTSCCGLVEAHVGGLDVQSLGDPKARAPQEQDEQHGAPMDGRLQEPVDVLLVQVVGYRPSSSWTP